MISFDAQRKAVSFKTAQVKRHSIPVTVKRIFTDVNGTIVDKTTVPLSMQTKYPFYMFGDFDRQGAYRIGNQALPPMPGTFYLMSFTYGVNQPFLFATGLNTVKGQLKLGDIVHIYTDNLETPNYFAWVIIQNNYASIAGIIGNSESIQDDSRIGQLYVEQYNYFQDAPSFGQWNEPLYYVRFDNIGTYKYDMIMPYVFKTPYTEQEGFLRIETKFKIDQYLGIYAYILYESDEIQFDFVLKYNRPKLV